MGGCQAFPGNNPLGEERCEDELSDEESPAVSRVRQRLGDRRDGTDRAQPMLSTALIDYLADNSDRGRLASVGSRHLLALTLYRDRLV